MTDIAERYTAIVGGLSAVEVAAVWSDVLFGRTPDGSLAGAIEELRTLRDEIGMASAARTTESTRDAA